MDFFDEISKEKKEFPKVHSVTKQVRDYPLNFYQILAIGIFIIGFFLGIIFGNLFATCKTSAYYQFGTCLVTEFNFALMLSIWFASSILSVLIFSVGHIIALLTEINKKLSKFHV